MLKILCSGLPVLLMLACGKSQQTTQPVATVAPIQEPDDAPDEPRRFRSYSVATQEELPPCDLTSEGFIAYIEASQTLKACISRSDGTLEWKDLNFVTRSDLDNFVTQSQLPTARAKALHSLYRTSIYRVAIGCTNGSYLLGTGYKCGDGQICTNKHVVECPLPYDVQGLLLYRLQADVDSVITTPFYSDTPSLLKSTSDYVDLAKILIPADLIAADRTLANATTPQVNTLSEVLSLSFPLGMRDLYSDLGYVKNNSIEECTGYWGSFCLSDYFDFVSSNDTDKGSSGSPLIDLESGKVVGITSAGLPGPILMNPNIATAASWFDVPELWP